MKDFFNYSYETPWFFTNYSFLLVLGLFLIIYSFLYDQKLVRKLYLIAFSLFFYYKSSGPFIVIFVALIFCDYLVSKGLEKIHKKAFKRLLLIFSVLLSLSFLLYFKYSGFFLENVNALFEAHFKIDKLFLPIGISFYTFQSISYIVDVYNGKIKSSDNFLDYCFYMTFFPHLVAGPIVRAKDFIPQINQPLTISRSILSESLFRILLGLGKKMLLADFLARYVDIIHAAPKVYSGFENLVSMYAYSCQIYFDFSGYSDIAIGIALLMGYQLKENFSNPYHAQNITDFWRRWHISLSSWLKDYIYIPLGGNKRGTFNTYLFLMITMTVGGIWHGASWKFVVWGIAHGLALAFHKLILNIKLKSKMNNAIKRRFGIFITFHFVSFLWIFFRSENFGKAFDSIKKIFSTINLNDIKGFVYVRSEVVFILVISVLIIFANYKVKEFIKKAFMNTPLFLVFVLMVVFFQIILQIKGNQIAPFIYFQF